MDREQAKLLYEKYVTEHWVDHGLFCGFREWPKGSAGPFDSDIDSGPVFMGIGSSASVLGLATTKAMGDKARYDQLVLQMAAVAAMMNNLDQLGQMPELRAELDEFVPLQSGYHTGFLFGDAVLFYALSWAPLPSEGDTEPENSRR